VLSDLIDLRRGEFPHPDGTRLSEPAMRPAVQLHLAACVACRDELEVLESLGSVYAEFSVGEKPAQSFENYGAKVRARMAGENVTESRVLPLRGRRFSWVALVASGLAASLAVVVLSRNVGRIPTTSASNVALPAKTEMKSPVSPPGSAGANVRVAAKEFKEKIPLNRGLRVMMPRQTERGVELVSRDMPMDQVNELPPEGQVGFLVIGEQPNMLEPPLLGAYLKTTRDHDKVEGQEPGGLMVYDVLSGSPAQLMGLKKNDYIVSMNQTDFNHGSREDALKFLSMVEQAGNGAPVTIMVVRPEGSQYCFMKPFNGVLGEYK